MNVDEVGRTVEAILAEVGRAVVGKREPSELLLAGLACRGHVLIEDLPGLAKTLLARSLASATSLRLARIQFTPDLLPADVTGSSVFDPRRAEFEFRPGPLFTNLLLGDEINRAPPKTQAALLEAMQERQATVDGVTHPLPRPFCVLATQNPIEFEGTYPLPEAQLDRFLLRISMGYPSPADEHEILQRRIDRRVDEVVVAPVIDAAGVVALQDAIEDVHVAPSILDYVVAVVGATRDHSMVQVGASPRGSEALVKVSRARAAMAGRDFVTPEDVKAVAVPALAHRLVLRPEQWVRGARTDDVVAECLDRVPTPAARDAVADTPR
jgi:MoxR-like ATPase